MLELRARIRAEVPYFVASPALHARVRATVGAVRASVPSPSRPTSEQVRAGMSGNLCRCGAYPGIERAVLRAAAELAG